MFLVTDPVALVHGSAGIVKLPVSMATSVHKLSYVFIPQRILGVGDSLYKPFVCSKTILDAPVPLAVILLLGRQPPHLALAMAHVVFPLAFIYVSRFVTPCAPALSDVVVPVTFVPGSALLVVINGALPMSLAVAPVANVGHRLRATPEDPKSVSQAVYYFAFIPAAVRPRVHAMVHGDVLHKVPLRKMGDTLRH